MVNLNFFPKNSLWVWGHVQDVQHVQHVQYVPGGVESLPKGSNEVRVLSACPELSVQEPRRFFNQTGGLKSGGSSEDSITAETPHALMVFLISMALLGSLHHFNAQAQTELLPPEPQALKPITITASRNQTLLQEMTTHTSVISAEDIQKAPVQTLDELLKTVPGFNFSGAPSYMSDPTGTQTKIRGLGNAKVLVLLDGVPMLDPFYLTTQWFRVPLSNIERVEIVRGGSSSLWGSMAVGGVVNVITRKPNDNDGHLLVSDGAFNTSHVSIDKNVLLSDELRLNVGASQLQTHGYQVTPSQYLALYPGKAAPTDTSDSYQLSAYWTPSADLSGFLKLGYFIQNQDLYGVYGQNLQQSPNLSVGVTQFLGDAATWDHKFWSQNVHFNKTNGSGCYWVSAQSCLNGNSSPIPTPTQTSLPSVNYFTQYGVQSYQERGASSVYSMPLTGSLGDLQVGADVRQLSVLDSEQYYGSPTVANLQNLTGTALGQGTQTFAAAFLQTQWQPFSRTRITLSGRADYWANTQRSYSLSTPAHGLSPGSGAAADNSKTQFNPTLGIHQLLSEGVSLRASIYKAFRAPGLNNQTRSYATTIANPNLMPETLTGWELGFDVSREFSEFSATYYLNHLNNMIATSNYTLSSVLPQPVINLCSTSPLGSAPNLINCGSSVSFYSNDQNATSSGLELSEKLNVTKTLTLEANYAYTRVELTSTWNGVTTPIHTQLAGIPQNTASLASTWKPKPPLRLYLQMNYIGPLSYYQSASVNAVQGANVILNASLSYQWDESTRLFLNAVNLLNRSYQDGTYTPSAPQTQTLSPPRMLSVGLATRF
jgi:outer membrane receptor protein involved in Fe transport